MTIFLVSLALFASLVAVLAAREARRGNPYPELRKAYRANVSAVHDTLEVPTVTKFARIKATLKIWYVKLAIFAAALASLAGCGELKGEVVDKQYFPSYSTPYQVDDYRQECRTAYRTAYRTTYSGSGKNQRSTTTAYQQSYQQCRSIWIGSHAAYRFHPSCHRLSVRNDDGKVKSSCISEQRYYSVNIGQRYDG